MSTSLSKKQKKQRNKEETHMEEGTHQSKSGEKETKTEKRKGILPFFFKQLKKKKKQKKQHISQIPTNRELEKEKNPTTTNTITQQNPPGIERREVFKH